MPTRFIGKTACIRAYVYARQAARLWGSLAGIPLWVRPIVNRPTAALAPDGGGSQPPRLPVAGPIAPPGGSGRWRGGRVGGKNIKNAPVFLRRRSLPAIGLECAIRS